MPVRAKVAGLLAVVTLAAASCSSGDDDAEAVETDIALFDSLQVHQIEVTFDQDDFDAMVDTYADNGDKEWIEATVTIDGETYEQAGMRLKGNSSLMGLGGGFGGGGFPGRGPAAENADETADGDTTTTEAADEAETTTTEAADEPAEEERDPETLPWLIRLDEFVEGQDHQGYEDIVVRSNSSATSLNEAVALDLLTAAGLASEKAVSTSFRVNGGDPVLRLAIEHPDDDAWQESAFDGEGALYKAESTGDWSYRGDDPAEYEEVFDQEGGSDVTDLGPLIDFLQFLEESDDATFAAELTDRLDVDAFATYLAMMDLLGNFDDIDGPGNNAYLWYDAETEQFTVVPWDMNLALGTGMGGPGGGEGGGPGGFDPGQLPEGFEPPAGGEMPELPEGFDPGQLPEGFEPPTDGEGGGPGGGGPGGFGRTNPLVERFHANSDFEALYQEKLTDLRANLYESGAAAEILATRVDTLTKNATDLVDEATITEEADTIREQFSAE
jgi:spore coat protein CotH